MRRRPFQCFHRRLHCGCFCSSSSSCFYHLIFSSSFSSSSSFFSPSDATFFGFGRCLRFHPDSGDDGDGTSFSSNAVVWCEENYHSIKFFFRFWFLLNKDFVLFLHLLYLFIAFNGDPLAWINGCFLLSKLWWVNSAQIGFDFLLFRISSLH